MLPSQNNRADVLPSLGRVPPIEEQELKEGESGTLEELKNLLPQIPDSWEDVSYAKIPLTHATLLQIMFIGAAVAKNPQELLSLSKLLEDLNNSQLRKGVRRCIAMLEQWPDIKNLTELFQQCSMLVK